MMDKTNYHLITYLNILFHSEKMSHYVNKMGWKCISQLLNSQTIILIKSTYIDNLGEIHLSYNLIYMYVCLYIIYN